MMKQRAKITISWDLDMVPGWNDSPKDVTGMIEKFLKNSIPHYNPKVDSVEMVEHNPNQYNLLP